MQPDMSACAASRTNFISSLYKRHVSTNWYVLQYVSTHWYVLQEWHDAHHDIRRYVIAFNDLCFKIVDSLPMR